MALVPGKNGKMELQEKYKVVKCTDGGIGRLFIPAEFLDIYYPQALCISD